MSGCNAPPPPAPRRPLARYHAPKCESQERLRCPFFRSPDTDSLKKLELQPQPPTAGPGLHRAQASRKVVFVGVPRPESADLVGADDCLLRRRDWNLGLAPQQPAPRRCTRCGRAWASLGLGLRVSPSRPGPRCSRAPADHRACSARASDRASCDRSRGPSRLASCSDRRLPSRAGCSAARPLPS